MTGEIIIWDTISVYQMWETVYQVSCSIMLEGQVRSQAIQVSVAWNTTAGYNVLKSNLINAYYSSFTIPNEELLNEIKDLYGTKIPLDVWG